MSKIYSYFVSYAYKNGVTSGYANLQTKRPGPIEDITDIVDLANTIEDNNNYPRNTVSILYFREF